MNNDDFFILVDKPSNMTSHKVCLSISKKLGINKIGHNGTLDPNTTGVLLLACNKATKLLPYFTNEDKTYVTTIIFGIHTKSLDIDTEVIANDPNLKLDEKVLDKALNTLLERKTQIPPIISSIKVNGKKLYDYARQNEVVEIKARATEIYELQKLSPLRYIDNHYEIDLKLHVKKGFYVRSFARDLGELCNTYAVVKKLRRVKASNFSIEECNTYEEVLNNNYKRLEIRDVFNYKVLNINERLLKFVKNGVSLYKWNLTKDCNIEDINEYKRFYVAYNNIIIGIYELQDEEYRPLLYLKGLGQV